MDRLTHAIFPLALVFATATLSGQAPAPGPTPVIVETVAVERFAERVEALGTLRANETVTITAPVTETIAAIHFSDGDPVAAGQLLVEMTADEERALLEEAEAALADAERQYERARQLGDSGGAAEQLIDERRLAVESGRARVRGLESRIRDRIIRAPFGGTLGLREVSVGALVTAGQAITTLDDLSEMKLDFTVPSLYLNVLRPGITINAHSRAFPDRDFTGTIRAIDTRIDPVTRSVTVRAAIPNPDGLLRPGLLMTVEIEAQPRENPAVGESAIVPVGTQAFLYVIAESPEGTVAERREVIVGRRTPGRIEIIDGIEPGERVVVHGSIRLQPGSPVRILSTDTNGLDLKTRIEG